MTTLLLSFVILVLIVVGMSVGVIFAKKPIKGSCGGMAALGMKEGCDICGGNDQKCEEEQKRQANNDETKTTAKAGEKLFYDAGSK